MATILEAHLFGDPSKFAIKYRPCPDDYNYNSESKMAICHMIIANKIIGNPDEECYLPTWFFNITYIRDFIKANRETLYPKEFEKLTNREIFESIIKSNQLDEEFDKNFLYLLQLNNNFWKRHFLTIDETIDAFSICFFVKNSTINFIIENWWPEELNQNRENFFYSSVELNIFLEIFDDVIEFLETTYPFLIENKNRYTF